MRYHAIFEATPGILMVLSSTAEHAILAVNDGFLAATMTDRERLIGQPILSVFPERPNMPEVDGALNLMASINRVLETKKSDHMSVQRYDIRDSDGNWVERFWKPVHIPIFTSETSEEILYILQCAEDITTIVQLTGQKEW